jgi:hypothetical protein
MSKFDTLLEEYRKALAYPEQKRSELNPMIAALTEKEHAAKETLQGVTLESLVVAERVARAVRRAASLGNLDRDKFPLLLHVDDIISKKAEVDIPWKQFSFVS